MGQKIHPFGFRLGPQFTWKSRWFATGAQYRKLIQEDTKLRETLMERLKPAGVTGVEIERSLRSIGIKLMVTRPGVVIGRGGSGIEELRKFITAFLDINPKDSRAPRVDLNVEEVKNPDLSSHLVATRIADQLIRRIPHGRVTTRIMEQVMNSGARGVQVVLAGRIGGSEIGRTEKYSQGSVPRQTLRADIDFARVAALTKSGYVGIKVWIYQPA